MSKQLAPIDEVRSTITRMAPEFQRALPQHITPEKFTRILLTAITTTPALVKADRRSLLAACMKSAQAGLLPDGRESALVPFKENVQFIPMVEGMMKLVRNSGELATLTAQVVHKNDKFRFWVDGEGEHIEHEPLMFDERGDAIGAYALAKTKDGAVYIEVMTRQQVMDIKNVSRAKDSGPWSGNFELEMWKKSAIKRLFKRLPKSTDLDLALRADDDLTDFDQPIESETVQVFDPEPEPVVVNKSKKLSKLVNHAENIKPSQPTPEPEPESEPIDDDELPI